jgi:hypothetical protein
MPDEPPSRLVPILELRLLVGFLGERAQFNWWPTSFFEHSSRLFLEPVFARTPLIAQYHGVLEAARRFHDEHLSAGAFHLFRLPEEMEEDLHALVRACQKATSPPSPSDKNSALDALKAMASTFPKEVVGPLTIGSVHDVTAVAKLGEIAAIYSAAFDSDRQAFPYFLQ